MATLSFPTDVHGSDICWKKLISAGKFYGADIIILGGFEGLPANSTRE